MSGERREERGSAIVVVPLFPHVLALAGLGACRECALSPFTALRPFAALTPFTALSPFIALLASIVRVFVTVTER